MFNNLFKFYYNNIETPNIISKLNMWFYINLRIFKIKLNTYIIYHINILNNLKQKTIKIYYNYLNFEYFYYSFIKYIILILILLLFI